MSLIYDSAPDKPVLKDITCEIRGGEKIGIVGRTGAGKSSVISALFRMVEPTGRIVIDGVDTKRIGLHDLRRALAIIPQEPVVFSGTIRSNLDPFSEHSDTDIWSALESVQLQDVVSAITGGLDASLSGGGLEFSAGQRQLVCLARAILRHNRVLVLDEATANVDHQTDALIQRIIRTSFHDCTVLTIAHRLNTIIDCDRVMVLDQGRLCEFDDPHILLERMGMFYDMCQMTGPDMAQHLHHTAKEAFIKKSQISLILKNTVKMQYTPAEYEEVTLYPKECARAFVQSIVSKNKEYDIIVDLGCGTGYLVDLLSQSVKHKRIVGLDICPNMIAFAEQNHKPMDSVQYLVQDLSQSWDSLSPVLKALESKVSLIVSDFVIHWFPDKSRLMHVVSKLLAKNGEFVANYVRTPDVMSLLTDEQSKQYNIQLQTKSESQQLDEIQTACSHNGLNVTKNCVILHTSRVNKYAIKCGFYYTDTSGPLNFGPAFQIADKTSPLFAFMRNIMFDIALRPDATALNPHAYDQLAHKWDPNGPAVPTYYHGIHI
ncbi:unnamed protein product, partial [Medioppia subpectinata]